MLVYCSIGVGFVNQLAHAFKRLSIWKFPKELRDVFQSIGVAGSVQSMAKAKQNIPCFSF
jgi:hypothetical protein